LGEGNGVLSLGSRDQGFVLRVKTSEFRATCQGRRVLGTAYSYKGSGFSVREVGIRDSGIGSPGAIGVAVARSVLEVLAVGHCAPEDHIGRVHDQGDGDGGQSAVGDALLRLLQRLGPVSPTGKDQARGGASWMKYMRSPCKHTHAPKRETPVPTTHAIFARHSGSQERCVLTTKQHTRGSHSCVYLMVSPDTFSVACSNSHC